MLKPCTRSRQLQSEAVEQAVAATALQVLLAAATGLVGTVPGTAVGAAAFTVVVTCLSTALSVGSPDIAGQVVGTIKRISLIGAAGQNVMAIRSVATAINNIAFFINRVLFVEFVIGAVQIIDAGSDLYTFSVVPGA